MSWESQTSPSLSAFFNTTKIVLKYIFHNNVYKADFTELSSWKMDIW